MKIKKMGGLGFTWAIILLGLGSMGSASICANSGQLPPKYLQVPGWQQCTSVKKISTWRSLCLPGRKPDRCLESSWQMLHENSGLPGC